MIFPDFRQALCKPSRLLSLSLADAEYYYLQGRATKEELIAYLREWNATPGRFTCAVWKDRGVRQFDKDSAEDARYYSEEMKTCGASV